MRNKKVRGLRRKTKEMIKRIEEETNEFPSDFYNGYWHLKRGRLDQEESEY